MRLPAGRTEGRTGLGAASPKILHPKDNTVITKEGEGLNIQCRARTKYQRFHNIYWLVNNTFVEDAYPDGRVSERSGGLLAVHMTVEQALNFTLMEPEDFRTTFTCVVQDPSGSDMKNFILSPEDNGCIRLIEVKDRRGTNQKRR
ncbi:interleukin-1 receptor type 2-like isoform 2-T2 [Anomaloglossus baeobatrachus]|uniref:interleukin-1 receptor type 2-like isoform X2 n=1 Tax=Anomaloglossus baeobatrachus TaxID=238106 RepID=UPI003F5067A7